MGENRGVPVLVMLAASALVAGASAAGPARSHGTTPAGLRAASPAGPGATSPAKSLSTTDADSGLTLKSGEEGTMFRTLTVEGEDRIHFEVERPDLRLEVDPRTAPGLDWGTARDVLDRSTPDLAAPYLELSARQPSPWRSEEHTSELQSPCNLVCRLLLEKKKKKYQEKSNCNLKCAVLQENTSPDISVHEDHQSYQHSV